MIRDGNKMSGNQRQEWEMFKLMPAVSTAIRRHFVFNFRLRGYPAYFICIFADVNRNIIE